MPEAKDILKTPLSRMRGTLTKGFSKSLRVAGFDAMPDPSKQDPPMTPPGGEGVIENFAVITRGEALGHGFWVDSDMLAQTNAALAAAGAKGVKSRFTHPSLSSDGLGKFLGRTVVGKVEGDVVRGSLRFSETAYETPDGNLAKYVADLAANDPEAFGASIVFDMDYQAMTKFAVDHGAIITDGGYVDWTDFKSPDQFNTKNLPHARLKKLYAVDIVDDPAANPSGLFHRGQDLAKEAEALFAYAAGVSDAPPQLAQLDADPDRVAGAFKRFLTNHGLEIKPVKNDNQQTPPAQAGATPAAKTGKDFLSAFGQQGAVWFAEGKTWEEAQALHTQALAKENEDLKKQLADKDAAHKAELEKAKQVNTALAGEKEPLSAGVPAKTGATSTSTTTAPSAKLASVLPNGLATFAAANPIPTAK